MWDALEGHTSFASLVDEANRIKLEGYSPFKKTIVEQSVPEVALLPAGKRIFEENDCSGCSTIQVIHLTIASGVQRSKDVLDVQWAVEQALYEALNGSSSLYDLEWESEKVIKDITLQPWEEGLSYDELNRSLKGWSAILPMEVKIRTSRTLLGVS